MSSSKLTRREVVRYGIAGGLGMAIAPVLAACGGGPSDEEAASTTVAAPAETGAQGGETGGSSQSGTVETWSPDTRDDALASEKWWDEAFAAANPGVEVKQLTVPYGEDTTKLKAGDASGVVPDIIWTYTDFLYTYGLDGLVMPVADVIEKVGTERFLPGALAGIGIDNTYYSVPFVGFPFFVYYRKDLYEAAGLQPPTTHEEMLANIAALNDPPNVYGYMLTNQAISDTWNLKTAMWTNGAYFFDEAGNLALDRPETITAWTFYKELGKYTPPGSMAQSDLESRQLMIDGKVAHMFTTTSFAADFTPENIDQFGGFLYPSVPGAKGASLDFYGLSIPTRAKEPELAKAMIEFLLEPANFQEYLKRTVVGWVPMLGDAYTDQYLSDPRIAPISSFIELGGQSAENGVVGTGYFGPTASAAALVATDIEKNIGDRLVVNDESPEDVLAYALETIQSAI